MTIYCRVKQNALEWALLCLYHHFIINVSLEIMKRVIYVTSTILLILILSLFTFSLITMKTLTTEITINAAPKEVWKILMDHEKYPNWNPFIKHISGNTQIGQHLTVTIHLEGKEPMDFTPVVLKNEKEKEFRWLGHLFVKGLFDGEHYFKIEALGSNQTKLIHGENFSGLMSGVIIKMIGDNTHKGFYAMNNALKKKAETINQ